MQYNIQASRIGQRTTNCQEIAVQYKPAEPNLSKPHTKGNNQKMHDRMRFHSAIEMLLTESDAQKGSAVKELAIPDTATGGNS